MQEQTDITTIKYSTGLLSSVMTVQYHRHCQLVTLNKPKVDIWLVSYASGNFMILHKHTAKCEFWPFQRAVVGLGLKVHVARTNVTSRISVLLFQRLYNHSKGSICVTHWNKFVAAVSIGKFHHLCFGLPVSSLVAAHDPTDVGGPEAVSDCQCEGTRRL